MSAATSYEHVYTDTYPRFRRECRTIGRSALDMLRVQQSSHQTSDPAIGSVVLRLVTESDLVRSRVDFGAGARTLSGRAGSFYLAPPDAVADWEADGSHEILLLAIEAERLRRLTVADGAADPLAPLYGREVIRPEIAAALQRIWREGAPGDPASALIAEGMFLSLLGQLQRIAGEVPAVPDAREKALDARRVALVTEFVDAHLEAAISVEDMAAAVALSPAHFARRFRLATASTPHAFVLSRRIARASALLRDTDMAVAEIAHACGFSSQSHLTARFRAALGAPPAAYRRALRA